MVLQNKDLAVRTVLLDRHPYVVTIVKIFALFMITMVHELGNYSVNISDQGIRKQITSD
jgi:hypothetical protein